MLLCLLLAIAVAAYWNCAMDYVWETLWGYFDIFGTCATGGLADDWGYECLS